MRVRRAGPGDAAIVRDVRLQALADAPDDFDSSLEVEREWTDADWRAWIDRRAAFVLEVAGAPKGIAAGEPHRDDPRGIFLGSMWVDPGARGAGAADRLIAAVLDWAQGEGATSVELHVDERNTRARGCYERNGFRATGETMIRARDGLPELEMRRLIGGDA